MSKVVLIVVMVLFCFVSPGKKNEPFYPVSSISPELVENANSVVRNKMAVLEIFSKEKVIYTVKEIITVLNSNGDGEGVLYLPYNSKIRPDIISANFYDKNGDLIKKVKKTEIYDQCYFDGFSLYNDARFKRITPHISSYPYTVEYECSMEFNGILDYPDWMAPGGYNKSIEYSGYEIKIHDDLEIKFKENEVSAKVKGEVIDGIKTYLWETEKMQAMEREPYAVPLHEIVPYVQLSPVEFSYYKNEGKMDSWNNFGIWIGSLLEDRDKLPEERITFLTELVNDEPNEFDKVKKVYEYLQEKTRYVSIQLGIGGFQPFAAETVDEVGYGDCKALTNYMKAMLSAVGIESYYTLVNAGRSAKEIDPLFPSQDFNHVILTVAIDNDTLFLECTSQFNPCGYLSDFTSGRHALMISDTGSELVKTKSYDESVNTWNSTAFVKLNETGNAVINDTVVFSGLQYDMIEDELRKTKEKQIESEFKNSDITGANYKDIKYEEQRKVVPSAKRIREVEVSKLATVMGDRMFLPLNSLNKRTSVPKKKTNRQYPFRLRMSYFDSDKIIYNIPDDYGIEYLPEQKEYESEFGKFSFTVEIKGNKIIYCRKDLRKSGTFPPDKYSEYVKFSKDIVNADSQKIVLKKL